MDVERKLDMSLEDVIKQSTKSASKKKTEKKATDKGSSRKKAPSSSAAPAVQKGGVSKRRSSAAAGVTPKTALALKRLKQAPRVLPSNKAPGGAKGGRVSLSKKPTGEISKREAVRAIEAAQEAIRKAEAVLQKHTGRSGAGAENGGNKQRGGRGRGGEQARRPGTANTAAASSGARDAPRRAPVSQPRRAVPRPTPVRLPSGDVLPSRMAMDHTLHVVRDGRVSKPASKPIKTLNDRFESLSMQAWTAERRGSNKRIVMP